MEEVMEYTREQLIELCDKAIVPFEKWQNRDTPKAQSDIGTIRAYLKAGCKYRIVTDMPGDPETIWLQIHHYQFEDGADWHLYYMPSQKKIDAANGGDWY
jgi:hypothetical protein